MPDTLFDKLEMPSTPARPFEDDGVVMTACATPLLPFQVWSQCEDLVAAHLAQVCAWPEDTRGRGWMLSLPAAPMRSRKANISW